MFWQKVSFTGLLVLQNISNCNITLIGANTFGPVIQFTGCAKVTDVNINNQNFVKKILI
jgi:hypothetical protein